jgi:hypothetical protein
MNNIFKVALITLTLGAMPSQSFEVKIPGMSEKEEKSVSVDALAMQTELIANYVDSAVLLNESQALLADAFGLKDAAAELRAQGEVLSSGSVLDKDAIKKNTQVSTRANDQISAKLDSSEELSLESQALYAQAIPPYAEGLYKVSQLSDDLQNFSSAAKDKFSEASMTKKLSVKKELSAGTYLASSMPGYTKDLYETSKLLISYAKKSEIEIPKDSTDALGALDF